MEIILDKYIKLHKIGSGSQGEVYLAKLINHEFGLEKKVVIKLFPKTDAVKSYFVNEVKALSKMNHQNIISILDANETDENYILVLEYINGLNLKEFCDKLKVKKVKASSLLFVEIVHKIFKALQYAHNKSHGAILHHVSPHNILIADDGQIKLIDFGISQIEGDSFRPNGKGKSSYLPEDILNGSKAYDANADIYSLGVTLERSCEEAGLEISSEINYLIKTLKEFRGNY
jgi:serine/threonine-protein kinase